MQIVRDLGTLAREEDAGDASMAIEVEAEDASNSRRRELGNPGLR